MTRPAQQALSDVAQALRQAGVTSEFDQDLLEELLMSVRARVRAADHHGTTEAQRIGALKALRPIWSFVSAQSELQNATNEVKSDLCWNIFAASLARTTNADAFPDVTGDLNMWQQLVDTLARGVSPQSSVQSNSSWSSNRAVKCAMLGLFVWRPRVGSHQAGNASTSQHLVLLFWRWHFCFDTLSMTDRRKFLDLVNKCQTTKCCLRVLMDTVSNLRQGFKVSSLKWCRWPFLSNRCLLRWHPPFQQWWKHCNHHLTRWVWVVW